MTRRGRTLLLAAALALAGSCSRRGDDAAPSPMPSSPAVEPGGLEVAPLSLTLDGEQQQGILVRVDLERFRVDPRAVPERRLEALARDPSVLVAVNAGYFEPDGSPSGLLAGERVRFGLPAERGGAGVLVVKQQRATIAPFSDAFVPEESVELALQAGPRLIEPDGALGIRSDDRRRAPRTALCIGESGRRVDLVLLWSAADPARGPGLLQLAEALKQPLVPGDTRRCGPSLNLDGGPSTGVVFHRAAGAVPSRDHLPLGPVPWALAVTRRAGRQTDGGS